MERTKQVDDGAWAVLATLALAGTGVGLASPILVGAATIPLVYLLAALAGTAPSVSLTATRRLGHAGGNGRATIHESSPGLSGSPGDRIAVETTVENTGDGPLVDVRVVDGVPDDLPVVAGSPRLVTTLDPGETATLSYVVELRRGEHTFADLTVRARDLTGTVARTEQESVAGDQRVTCFPAVETLQLDGTTNDYAGQVPADDGGSGVEFHSVREYEPGDPVGAIDWRRYANSRELATVQYRVERSTQVLCVVDTRNDQFRTAADSKLTAVELSAYAAERTAETLFDAGHPTGVACVDERRPSIVPPGVDAETREAARTLLADLRNDHGADQTYDYGLYNSEDVPVEAITTALPGEAQVFLFSSATDDGAVEFVRRLRGYGYEVTVVSPAVTDGDDTASRIDALARQTRLSEMRTLGATVVDWEHDRSLELAVRAAVGEVTTP